MSVDDENSYFGRPWKNSDAILIVEGEELHVHISILSLASPVFDKMFSGNFKESHTRKVELTGKTYELIEHVLKFIYPNVATTLDLDTNNICSNCLPEKDTRYRSLPCKECRDSKEMRPFCTLCINNTYGATTTTGHFEMCIKCKHFFVKSKLQRKRRLLHLQQLYQLSQEYIMSSLQKSILTETVRMSQQLPLDSKDIATALELLLFADSIDCDEAVANCLRHVSAKHGFHSSVVNNGSLDSLSNLLLEMEVGLELRLKLMGLILKRQLKELMPHPSTEKKEAWDDVVFIAKEMIRTVT